MPKGLSITSSHPDLFYSLIDFIFSYVTGVRTLNGEVEDEEVREIIISISQVLSSKQKSNFVYASVHAVVEMMRFKFLSSPLGFNKESLPIFLNDVIEILARKEWVLVVLSEVSRIVKKKALVRKLDYFRVLVSDMDEKVLEVLRIGIKQEGFLLFDSSEGLTTPAAKKPLIEEI